MVLETNSIDTMLSAKLKLLQYFLPQRQVVDDLVRVLPDGRRHGDVRHLVLALRVLANYVVGSGLKI